MTGFAGRCARRFVLAAAAAACFFASGPADAARVTWAIDGTVPDVSDELNSLGLLDGASYRYEVTYESSTPASESPQSCCTFTFSDAVLAASFSSGTFAVALPPGETRTFLAAYNNIRVEGPVILEMINADPGASPTLPLAPPAYFGTVISLRWGNTFGGTGFVFVVGADQLSYSVPEPALALLAFAGFLAVAGAKR